MPARAMWKAVVSFGDLRLPVRMYSAVVDRSIHFHLLHDQDMVRVKQRMVNPVSGKTVPLKEALKGYPVDRDRYVVVHDAELEALEPETSRDIRIERFVEPGRINHQWFVRPYYLGPDGDEEDYAAFVAALERLDRMGIARWAMRKKEYAGVLRAEDRALMLITLRHTEEVIRASDLGQPEGRALDRKERDLAAQLITALQAEFNPAEYHDEYREQVTELIQAKSRGETVRLRRPSPETPKQTSLTEALRASLRGSAPARRPRRTRSRAHAAQK